MCTFLLLKRKAVLTKGTLVSSMEIRTDPHIAVGVLEWDSFIQILGQCLTYVSLGKLFTSQSFIFAIQKNKGNSNDYLIFYYEWIMCVNEVLHNEK